MPPELSIIIVNWNVRDLLRDCLRSIEAGRDDLTLEVIVVDSASSDGSVEMVRAEFPWVHLMACVENVGFPRGNNIGLAKAAGAYLLLLNPDTLVLENALPAMVAYLRSQPEIGALGPKLLNPDGSIQSSRRRFPTLATGFFESTWLERLAPDVLKHYYALDLPDDVTGDVDWVTGACIMVPRAAYETVGGLDEGYYMYSEELDWCRRIKESGRRVVYYPPARVIHHYGKSSEQAVTARHINFQRAKLRYFRKYHGRGAAMALRGFLLLSYAWQLVMEGVKGLLGSKPALRRQRVRAYFDVLRSGLPPAGY
jgi:N-acetylglucosaminyl-diphospho-decaprenol L-rhamnosyltransferase